jgi:hypothetical protein
VTVRERDPTEPEQRAAPELVRVDQRAELERTLVALLPRVRQWL